MKTLLLVLLFLAIMATVCSSKRKKKHFCKLPKVPGNSTVRYKRFHGKKFSKVGSKIIYSCNRGFVLHGSWKIRCLKTRRWSNAPPVCKVGRCHKPYGLKFLRNGHYVTDNENFEYMTTITIACNESYTVSSRSPDAMTCIQDNSGRMVWQPPYVPRCFPIRCGDPGTPDDGAMGASTFMIGSKVKFYCYSGYKLLGDEVRTCLPSGQWSGNQPVCDKGNTDCVNPGSPTNGRRFGDGFNIGDVVRFECGSGFTLYGSPKRRCKKDGNWTGIPATCEDDNKIIFPPLNETVDLLASNVIEALAPETCKTDEKGKCLRTLIRGRSINIDSANGLDVIFMIDSSSSIGKKNFSLALKLTKHLIGQFGVDYGPGGTRIAAITFNTRADLVYNLGDPHVDSVERAREETGQIRYLGGGTATRSGLKLIQNAVPMDRRRTTALIIITDGKHNVEGDPIDIAYDLRTKYGVKIYAIGIGQSINRRELRLLVGQRNKGHVFQLANYNDIDKIIEGLIHRDYSGCGEGYIKSRGRILGGQLVKKNSLPWMVAIFRLETKGDESFYRSSCGGAFIRDDLIITAAHCLEDEVDGERRPRLQEKQYRIISGETKIKRNLPDKDKTEWLLHNGLRVSNIIVHQNFTHGKNNKHDYDNDIALLQLEEPVTWSRRIRPICLPEHKDYLKEPASKAERIHGYVSGWGYTSMKNWSLPEELKVVSLGVNSNKTCEVQEFDKDKMFCAGDAGSKEDACKGDSGGPFAISLPTDEDEVKYRFKIMGIVSWATGACGDDGAQGYYTRVTNYLDWIEKTMSKI